MSTAPKHTPGPWRQYGKRIEYGPMVAGDGFAVAVVLLDPPEHEANARLIVAAPDLLEALRSLVEGETSACMRSEAVGETGLRERFTQARAAIAKATG